jgi:hypothetical protein
VIDSRFGTLRGALGFLRLPPTEPELHLLHQWLHTWSGVGVIAVGMYRQGLRLSLTLVADGEWRADVHGRSDDLGA